MPRCECGTFLIDEARLRKHKKNVCKWNTEDRVPPTMPCPDCDAFWASLASLNQHRRQAHPAAYNADMQNEAISRPRRGGPWSRAKEEELAFHELRLRPENLPQTRRNDRLRLLMEGRTAEAIRKRRAAPTYADALRSAIAAVHEPMRDEPSTRLGNEENHQYQVLAVTTALLPRTLQEFLTSTTVAPITPGNIDLQDRVLAVPIAPIPTLQQLLTPTTPRLT